MRTALLGLFALGSVSWGAPPTGLSPVVEEVWVRAERLELEEDLVRAREAYRSVFRVTGRPEAALAVARLHADEGETDRALAILAEAPDERDVLVAIVTLQLRADRQVAAARTLRRLDGYASEPDVVRLRAISLAHTDPLAASRLARDWLGFALSRPLDPSDAEELALILAARLREEGEHGAAVELLAQVQATVPEIADAVSNERERAAVKQLAEQLARSGAEPLGGPQRVRLAQARAAWEAGDAEGAAGMLDAIAVSAPRNPELRGLRARVRVALGRDAEAEEDLLAAEALDPLDPRWPIGLGDLLARSYSGRFHAEAVAAWDRALALEPRRPEIWLRKAELELALGAGAPSSWRSRAKRSLERVVELDVDGDLADEAERLIRGLERQRPGGPDLPSGRPCRTGVSRSACEAFYIARARWQRARLAAGGEDAARELDAALEQARSASVLDPAWEEPVNLQAHILRMRGEAAGPTAAEDRALSEQLYHRSLELDPQQPAIHVHLGKLREREGDARAAVEQWRLAVALAGPPSAPAHLYLAQDALAQYRIWEVRAHVQAYRAAGAGTAELDALAERLEARVDLAENVAIGSVAGLAGLVLGVPILWWWRRRPGKSVSDLLERDPSVWREVAGVASALRHEVLKHHTSVLPAVADALEDGDVGPAEWLAERLEAQDGPVARGRRYLDLLRELGRRSGVQLDLERGDPVFGPLVIGLDRLARCARPLSRGAARIAPELRSIAEILNGTAYPELGALVQRICVLSLDAPLIEQAWSSVLGEPAFRGLSIPKLEIQVDDGPAVKVRMWRDELDLVLVNLLRNALEASIDDGEVGRIGVRLVVEEDPVTFFERVAVRVLDDAPKRVSTAMIRGRYIDRGLGLTVDVISRNAGSIHVEDEPGWSKAVVVRLPSVESQA